MTKRPSVPTRVRRNLGRVTKRCRPTPRRFSRHPVPRSTRTLSVEIPQGAQRRPTVPSSVEPQKASLISVIEQFTDTPFYVQYNGFIQEGQEALHYFFVYRQGQWRKREKAEAASTEGLLEVACLKSGNGFSECAGPALPPAPG